MGERDNYVKIIADIVNEQSRDMAEISGEIERQKRRDKGEKVEGHYKVVHEWTYKPKNYLEEAIITTKDGIVYEIDDGRVTAEMDSGLFDQDQKGFRTKMNGEVELLLCGAQLIVKKRFDGPFQDGHIRTTWEGKQIVKVINENIELHDAVDAQVLDSKGNLKSDTKEERIIEQRAIIDLTAKHGTTDLVLAGIIQSFKAALNDHKKVLVHLYEIIEALEDKFKQRNKACKKLKIDPNDWVRLKKLANDEPLKEGRHSGKKLHNLRGATKQELEEATDFCSKLIIGYLRYLEENHDVC